ncbi:MAG TPA: TetR/AcrR family transcriptional regulator [Anaerolineaceae bacterium]|nr:TetR/AcrR family transcriptional regulator [Anaerolineaceae bacterium]
MDNRSNLLACALRLFADRGYDAVGIQEIVDAAEVTKPTLYHYFGNKYGLLEALLQAHFAPLNQLLRQAADYHHDLPLTLTNICKTFFQYARENPTFYRLQLGLWFAPENSEAHQAVARWNDEQYQIVEQVFLQAVSDHGNMRGRHSAYAATLIGMIHTYIGLSLNHRVELTDQLVTQAVHQFQHGIYS